MPASVSPTDEHSIPTDESSYLGRVLFVDDDPAMRQAFAKIIPEYGFEVDIVSTGHEAFYQAEHVRYAAFVVDLNMTPLDGIAVIERLRKLQPKSSCLLVTGEVDVNLPADRLGTQAISDIINKPWKIDELVIALRRAVRLHRARRTGGFLAVDPPVAPSPATILILTSKHDTGADVRSSLDATLTAPYSLVDTQSLSEAIALLKEHRFDLLIVSLLQPDVLEMDCVTSLKLASPQTPLIVVTDPKHEVSALQAIEHGAQDYIFREELTPSVVSRSIRYAIDRKRSEDRIAYLAHYDPLTGLANRTLFRTRVSRLIARAKRNSTVVALLLVDLDDFKGLNDSLGHNMGDVLIQRVGERLRSASRDGDIVARLGGDEFAVVMTDIPDADVVANLARNISTSLSRPLILGGRSVVHTASVGIAIFPHDAEEVDDLIRCADLALYRAKDTGRNGYQFYDKEMTEKVERHQTLISQLRRALARQEFCLLYQPQIQLQTGKVVAFEALLRWYVNDRLTSPLHFISTLESTGLIVPLGEWILHTACHQLAQWHRAGLNDLRVSVNLSPRQFRQDGLAEVIANSLKESGVPACCLEVELTEGIIMEDTRSSIHILTELKRMGVRISIDDFGTGYSSLAYLKRFPVDMLKIDRTFVKDIPHDQDDVAIANAIIALTKSLRLTAVAEGVETAEQAKFFKEQACEAAQGYYFSRPLSADDALTYIQRRNSTDQQ